MNAGPAINTVNQAITAVRQAMQGRNVNLNVGYTSLYTTQN